MQDVRSMSTCINGSFCAGPMYSHHQGHTLAHSPPQRALASPTLYSDPNACTFGIIRGKHHISLQHQTGEQKDLLSKLQVSEAPG